nr:TIM44-like domain-containing protein [Elusimicrobiota bacterium]
KAGETQALMESIARTDPDFAPEPLRGVVRDIFFKVQDAWQKRDYSGLGDIMLPYLRASHSSKVENLRRRGEINMMEDVSVKRVDFVHVSCPAGKEGRAFTAFITASARDYTIDESSGSLISGSRLSNDFQEFWTFHQLNGRWALARIDQVGETDYIGAPNTAAGLPDRPASVRAAGAAAPAGLSDPGAYPLPIGNPGDISMTQAPGAPGAPDAPAAAAAAVLPEGGFRPHAQAALPAAAARSVTGSSGWDRQKMEIAATLAFESVYTAWGGNDPAGLSADFVSGEALAKLRRLMEARKAEGITFGFDSFFTRRAEVVLTSPAEKNVLRLDEFTARITATALRSMRRHGKELHRDASPEPFTEYWVFGRQNESWKMRDILPRMDQAGEDKSKDGAPNPAQIEWYWETA